MIQDQLKNKDFKNVKQTITNFLRKEEIITTEVTLLTHIKVIIEEYEKFTVNDEKELKKLKTEVEKLTNLSQKDKQKIDDLQKSIDDLKKTPKKSL